MDASSKKPPAKAWEIGAFPHLCACGQTHWYRPSDAIGATWPCGVAVTMGDADGPASQWWLALLLDQRQRLMDG